MPPPEILLPTRTKIAQLISFSFLFWNNYRPTGTCKNSAQRTAVPFALPPTVMPPFNQTSKPKLLCQMEPDSDSIFKCITEILQFSLYFYNIIKDAKTSSEYFQRINRVSRSRGDLSWLCPSQLHPIRTNLGQGEIGQTTLKLEKFQDSFLRDQRTFQQPGKLDSSLVAAHPRVSLGVWGCRGWLPLWQEEVSSFTSCGLWSQAN